MKKIFLFVCLIFPLFLLAITPITQTSVVKPRKTNMFKEYDEYFQMCEQFCIIPGLKEGLIPQGLGYIPSKDWIVVSSYSANGPSVLSFLERRTGEYIKSLTILNEDGTYYNGHAGGIAVSELNLWISSEKYLRKIPLDDVFKAETGDEIRIESKFNTGTNASFASYNDGIIWVGEFYHYDNYLTDESHYYKIETGERNNAWIVGFKLDNETDNPANIIMEGETNPVVPDYIISCPDIVQGMAFLNCDDRLALSKSYGRTNDSTIQIYDINIGDNVSQIKIEDKNIPMWVLSKLNLEKELLVLPMSEGIIQIEDYFYILYESAAKKYLMTTKYATDYIWKVPVTELIN